MRAIVLIMVLAGVTTLEAQDGAKGKLTERFRMKVIPELFPQDSPQEALKSIVKAIETKRIGYLVAHLADPTFVDAKVAAYKDSIQGSDDARTLLAFARLVKETEEHFLSDPNILKELRKFASEGEWKTEESTAGATLKGLLGRGVFLKKMEERWFLENRQK